MQRKRCNSFDDLGVTSALPVHAFSVSRKDAPDVPTINHMALNTNQPGISKPEPSNSFFQESRNVSVSGGHFNSTIGHHTNLTIHIGRDVPVSSTEQVPDAYADSQRRSETGPSPPEALCDAHTTETQQEHELSRNRSYKDHPHQMATPMQKSNEIYEKQLSMKGRGFPLWIPEPNRRLPMSYRKEGVNIGDVGIITPSGGFSFLFNICLPAGDPINLGRVPEDFEPIYPRLDPYMDIREFFEFKQGSYLASTSIENSQSSSYSPDLFFESTASEGAILTMPEGAISFDLENIPQFRAYAAANVESWYRYVNGPRGREAKNGDIRLVTGCDKTTSWGMAILSNISQEKKNCLRFKAAGDPRRPSAYSYTWECSGMVEARVGPDKRETDELRRHERSRDSGESDSEEKYPNQCLFVRTLNLTLGSEMWERLNQELGLKIGSMQNQSFEGSAYNNIASHDTRHQGSCLPPQNGTSSFDTLGNGYQLQISMTTTPGISTSHPSKHLNNLLSKKFPGAKMIITHDGDWTSVAEEGILISEEHIGLILDKILQKCDIVQGESGILVLDAKKELAFGSFVTDSPTLTEDTVMFRGMEELSLELMSSFEHPETGYASGRCSRNYDHRRHSISEYGHVHDDHPPPLYSDIHSGVGYTGFQAPSNHTANTSNDASMTNRDAFTAHELNILPDQTMYSWLPSDRTPLYLFSDEKRPVTTDCNLKSIVKLRENLAVDFQVWATAPSMHPSTTEITDPPKYDRTSYTTA